VSRTQLRRIVENTGGETLHVVVPRSVGDTRHALVPSDADMNMLVCPGVYLVCESPITVAGADRDSQVISWEATIRVADWFADAPPEERANLDMPVLSLSPTTEKELASLVASFAPRVVLEVNPNQLLMPPGVSWNPERMVLARVFLDHAWFHLLVSATCSEQGHINDLKITGAPVGLLPLAREAFWSVSIDDIASDLTSSEQVAVMVQRLLDSHFFVLLRSFAVVLERRAGGEDILPPQAATEEMPHGRLVLPLQGTLNDHPVLTTLTYDADGYTINIGGAGTEPVASLTIEFDDSAVMCHIWTAEQCRAANEHTVHVLASLHDVRRES